MMVRAKAPLRIGLAGGGTDVSPFTDLYGGLVLNATINLYAYAAIEPMNEGIILESVDQKQTLQFNRSDSLPVDGSLDLLKGVYNHVVKNFSQGPLSFKLSTFVDAQAGSGLGTSSTLVVAVLGAFAEWLKLPLGEYDLAHTAFNIERKELNMAGGKQDQYCAAFGGFNFMEFYADDKVIVNPLRVKQEYLNELEFNLLLYNSGTSRVSSKIIEGQSKNIETKKQQSMDAMQNLKEQALQMKEAILKGNLNRVGEILDYGWQNKKKTAEGVSNPAIDGIYEAAMKGGATGGKISGAGGGGYMMFYCPGNTKFKVMDSLQKFGGEFKKYQFTQTGLTSWKI